jgi:hypothetical protein
VREIKDWSAITQLPSDSKPRPRDGHAVETEGFFTGFLIGIR